MDLKRPTDDRPLVEVFSTRDLTELEVVESLLESEGIQVAVLGKETVRSLGAISILPFPMSHRRKNLTARLSVREADANAARQLLAEFDQTDDFHYDPDSAE